MLRGFDLPSYTEVDLGTPDAPSFELCKEVGFDVRVPGAQVAQISSSEWAISVRGFQNQFATGYHTSTMSPQWTQ